MKQHLDVPKLRTWRYVKRLPQRKLHNRIITGLTGVLYTKGHGDTKQTAVVHRYHNRKVFVAWGLASAKHCGAYAVYQDGRVGAAISGCPQMSVSRSGGTVRLRIYTGTGHAVL